MPDNTYFPCDFCDGHGVPMGRLGRLWWFRCRSCGSEFAVPESEYNAVEAAA